MDKIERNLWGCRCFARLPILAMLVVTMLVLFTACGDLIDKAVDELKTGVTPL